MSWPFASAVQTLCPNEISLHAVVRSLRPRIISLQSVESNQWQLQITYVKQVSLLKNARNHWVESGTVAMF